MLCTFWLINLLVIKGMPLLMPSRQQIVEDHDPKVADMEEKALLDRAQGPHERAALMKQLQELSLERKRQKLLDDHQTVVSGLPGDHFAIFDCGDDGAIHKALIYTNLNPVKKPLIVTRTLWKSTFR